MTASRNKASRAVTAALVGVLSVGAVPMVAVAAESGATPLFVSPSGAFSGATVVEANFTQGGIGNKLNDDDGDGVWTTTYERNQPVTLGYVKVQMFSGDSENVQFTIDLADTNDYTVEYYERNAQSGEPTGEAITGDVVDAGNYVAVVTAVSGDYADGVLYVPFDINPIDITGIQLEGETQSVYDAEVKDITFKLDGQEIYDGDEISVTWYRTGNDLGEENVSEVKDAGTYRAYITGNGNYSGSVTLSDVVYVYRLNLGARYVRIADVVSDSASEPDLPEYVWIGGTLYGPDSALVSELKAELTEGTDIWYPNGEYNYVVTAADDDDENIYGFYTLKATKYSQLVSWQYDGEALSDYQEVFFKANDDSFDPSKVVATDAKGKEYTLEDRVSIAAVYDEDGRDYTKLGDDWTKIVGTYTVIYEFDDDNSYDLGGQIVLTVHVYSDVVDADATAAVSFEGTVVSSIETTYDGANVIDDIKVTVQDDNGTDVLGNCTVSYYDANGNQVREIKNAGTYTLKVTSDYYKLTGTTEMTITVNPVTIGTVSAAALETKTWDKAGVSAVTYLPQEEGPYGIAVGDTVRDLGLYYVDETGARRAIVNAWTDPDGEKEPVLSGYLTDVVKVTITDADGDVVDTIADEGVYTISFEARNSDAENNYVMPGDLTVECINSRHLYYADVTYTQYFADSVADVTEQKFMTGYADPENNPTGIFGATNMITRADVACVLYNMANERGIVETQPTYDADRGYITGFDDCDGNAYYAKAVAWCRSVGVVNGYDEDTFGPTDYVTREQFACMLANYEQVFGDYETADTSVLDEFSDADEASSYAEANLAWAVSEGVLQGTLEGDLNPTDSIIRADVAVMIARYVG